MKVTKLPPAAGAKQLVLPLVPGIIMKGPRLHAGMDPQAPTDYLFPKIGTNQFSEDPNFVTFLPWQRHPLPMWEQGSMTG